MEFKSFYNTLTMKQEQEANALGGRNLIQQRMKTAAHNIALLSGTADSFKNHEVYSGTVPQMSISTWDQLSFLKALGDFILLKLFKMSFA